MTYPELTKEAREKLSYWKTSCRKKISKEDWDITFLKQAFEWSKKTSDAQTGHGAVLVTPQHRIIATGYNGFVRNIDDDVLPNLRPDKHPWVIHAENNAILSCAYQGTSAKGCIMYVTGEPCLTCYQIMYQAGVAEIVYGNRSSNMLTEDVDYRTNVEIFLWLVREKLCVRHINYGV